MGRREFEWINIEELAIALTDEWFKQEYEDKIPGGELYEVVLEEGKEILKVSKYIKDRYAVIYFNRLSFYQELINGYIKK